MWEVLSLLAPNGRARLAPGHGVRPRVEALEDRHCPSGGTMEWADPTGHPDPTFDADGIDTVAGYQGRRVAVQADGKIVAAGYGVGVGYDFQVVRRNPNGGPDTTFGTGGTALTDFNRGNDLARGLVIQPDGKIIVAGQTGVTSRGQVTNQNALVRYNPNGTLDTTFGSKGKVVSAGTGGINDIVLQPDGKILAVGISGTGDVMLTRYTATGALDSTFGSGGKVVTDFFGLDDVARSLALQGDGKVVVSGVATQPVSGGTVTRAALVRYNSNGGLDPTFGAGGKVYSDAFEVTSSPESTMNPTVALQVAGGQTKILLGGGSPDPSGTQDNFELDRYNPDGSLDTSFGAAGRVVTDIGLTDFIHALVVQPDGRIVAVGETSFSATYMLGTFAMARYTAEGMLDKTFATGGLTAMQLDPSYGGCYEGVTLQADGRIVGVGSCHGNFVLTRHVVSAPQIGSFTASSTAPPAGSSVTLTAANITDGNPGATVTEVALYILIDGTPQLLGYAAPSGNGSWAFTFSTAGYAPGTYTLYAQATDSYGAVGDPVALTLAIQ